MDWPRIVYHKTDGMNKLENGITYKRCESQEEFDKLEKSGWRITPNEVNDLIGDLQIYPKSELSKAESETTDNLNQLLGAKKASKKASSRKRR
jgi:hypothetical protein